MANTDETVADIVNEMRNKWAQCYYSEGTKQRDGDYFRIHFERGETK